MNDNEEIVISGISGKYPDCRNIEDFAEALFNGVDLVTDDERRFPRGVEGIPPRCGKIPDLDKFDATYFGIHAKQAEFMDPRQRILCETVYECIVDAGFNPQELRGSKTGVYVAISIFSNPEKLREQEDTDGYTNIGLSLALAANRISYCFDFKGKSYSLDTACSSALYGFVNAVDDMRSGLIDSAVVCAAHLILHPHETSEFNKLNMLSADGKCKVFSTLRDGYARSEAIISTLLQKGSECRRSYATVLGARSNADGHKTEGITYPSAEMQVELMSDVYPKQRINPDEVAYVEAHGTGTPAGDIEELKAIVTMLCRNRKAPLSVGAVKSNMGHSETSAGLCSLSKVLIAMEKGVIPANLHFEPLDTELPGIRDNKIKIVTENVPWNGGLAALNCFGFGGANAHIVLKSNLKEKRRAHQGPKHRLVQVSGRTEEALHHFLDQIEMNRDDEEFLALVDEVHKMNCEGHNFRGYTILGEKPKREVSRYSKARPIWLIYTGMGSQWLGMGKDMMSNEVFRNSIKRCADALRPYGVDLEKVLTCGDPSTFDNPSHCFTGIAAVEIAMTDVLYSLGIVPDGIAGHSLGEVGCSYADSRSTPEETILLAYARGFASQSTKLPAGAMAAIGLSPEDCLRLLPDDIFIACRNGKKSATISGPAKSVTALVDHLTAQGIFARKVHTGGLAYHSKYIADAAPYLYEFVKKVLKDPKARSKKWLSTSVAEHQKNESWARFNSAEYHRNNFCNTVLFDEVYKHVPEDAIVIEVSPHGLLQGILKKELGPNNTVLSLADRGSVDNVEFFLSALGRLYLAGGQPNLTKLYRNVDYPVSRGTKMLSPLVMWDHNVSWFVPLWEHKDYYGNIVKVNISEEKYSRLAGHNIDGRVLMPATGYLELAWQTLAGLHLKEVENFPVIIENVRYKRATVLPPRTDVKFLVNIMKQSGYFEIFEGGSVVVNGIIRTAKDVSTAYCNAKSPEEPGDDCLPLTSEDIYKECLLRRYLYEGCFQGLQECDVYGRRGRIKWQGSFTGFLDTMLHLTIISETKRDLMLPTAIEKIVIDPREHLKQISEQDDLPIFYNRHVNVIRSGGVEICGLDSSKVARRKQGQEDPLLETYEFLPYEKNNRRLDSDGILSAAVQIILQNARGLLKTVSICEDDSKVAEKIKSILDQQPMVQAEYGKHTKKDEKSSFDVVILTENSLENIDKNSTFKGLNDSGMILYQGDIKKLQTENITIVYHAQEGDVNTYLLRPSRKLPSKYSVISVTNSNFGWLEEIKKSVRVQSTETVFLVGQAQDNSGVIGLTNCLLTEPNSTQFRCVLVQDQFPASFSLDDAFYRNQMAKDLTFNVWKEGRWGTLVHLPLKSIEKKEVSDATVSVLTVGDLSTLTWVQKPSKSVSPVRSEKVYVYYSALNFRDVMVATSKLQSKQADVPTVPEINVGLEYAGVTSSGRRVMGLVGYEGLSLQVQTDPDGFTWEVPDNWSLQEAATVPCVYSTCYYGMIVRGQMRQGESILIHAGTGGIGIAAIAIALDMGCKVFTTVGSQEKKDYLMRLYPRLEEANIGHSRNCSFRNMIMERTTGRGVDLVLNSLAGELFQESLRCIAERGRFLEIGKVDFMNRSSIDAKILGNNCSFHGVDLETFFGQLENDWDKRATRDLLHQGILDGVVKPLPSTVFKEDEVEDAFRFLSTGKHKGKVLIELRKESSRKGNTAPVRTISALPKVYFRPDKSYVVIGGLGGLGLELTDWMVRRGATKVVLNSRRQIHSGYQSYCLKKWSKWNGVTVVINTEDTTTLDGAKNLVDTAKMLAPVGGVFNMAVVLKDGLIENQTPETYEAVFKPKIASGCNMDLVTRAECPQLDHFVVFSSAACGRGNSGQSNYGMANSALERLCEKRKAENLPALAIQWGPIGEVGALTKTKIINKLADQMVAQNVSSCIEVLEKFMLQDAAVGSSIIIASKTASKSKDSTKTPAEAVAHILGIRDIGLIDKSLTLTQLGLDSLMVAEIKQTLYRNYQVEINADEIRDFTFSKLIAMTESDENNNTLPVQNGIAKEPFKVDLALLPKETLVTLNRNKNESRTIFMIHPIEGHIEPLKGIAKHLNATVYGLQGTREADFDSIESYAKYYLTCVKRKQSEGPYLLCGYSFGALVALEMCFQLEKSGERAQVVLLDGSPTYVTSILGGIYNKLNQDKDASKVAVLAQFITTFTGLDKIQVSDRLAAADIREKQLQLVGDMISAETGLDAGEITISADRYFKRYLACFYYDPGYSLVGKVLLIRGDGHHTIVSEDYDLQKLCKQKVEVLRLSGGHESVLLGENTRIISEQINDFF